ncbi:coenzyme A pyrophosphatase [Geobacter sp. SVR]|nr:coenzyme A pyrophosphatase [Geobacter sp. SVR]
MDQIKQISAALNSHPPRIIEPGGRARAAVALILRDESNGLNGLFIERSSNENDPWSGHIALPGGRAEESDRGPRHTAERETQEEIGLNLSAARYLGRLSDIAPGGLNIVISCFVYAVTEEPILYPDRHEIAEVSWFPVGELDRAARHSHVEFMFRGRMRRFPAVEMWRENKQQMWGITYRLLRNLNKLQTVQVIGSVVSLKGDKR